MRAGCVASADDSLTMIVRTPVPPLPGASVLLRGAVVPTTARAGGGRARRRSPAGAGRADHTVAIDDTLFRRRGKKVHGAGWFHDGSAAGQLKLGYGNNWIVVAIIVTLPYVSRPVALPVLATWRSKAVTGPNLTWPGTWWTPSPSGFPTAGSMWWVTRPTGAVRSPGWART